MAIQAGATRPGRMPDQTAVKTEGLDELLDQYPDVKFLIDSGYRGLANDHPDQIIAPTTETEEGRHSRRGGRVRGHL